MKKPDMTRLDAKIAELEKQLVGATDDEISLSQKAVERLSILMDEMKENDFVAGSKREGRDLQSYISKLSEQSFLANAKSELDGYLETKKLDLVKVETRYLITQSEDLISPAGFHPDEKVFIRPNGMIATNDRTKVPSVTGMKLFIHDLEASLRGRSAI